MSSSSILLTVLLTFIVIFSSLSCDARSALPVWHRCVGVLYICVRQNMSVSLKLSLSLSRSFSSSGTLSLQFSFPSNVWTTKRLPFPPSCKTCNVWGFLLILSFDEKKGRYIYIYINIYIQASADANRNLCGWRAYAPCLHTWACFVGECALLFFFLNKPFS